MIFKLIWTYSTKTDWLNVTSSSRMKLGYDRANRLMDQLETAGLVGPNQGSKARDVLIKTERELLLYIDTLK